MTGTRALCVCLVCVWIFSGCMQLKMLPYLDQALTLQEFGRDKDQQEKFVKNVDVKFDRLCDAINAGRFQQYRTDKDVIKAFGPPILMADTNVDGAPAKRALYRYAIQSKGSKKVYLYYDAAGHLIKHELTGVSAPVSP